MSRIALMLLIGNGLLDADAEFRPRHRLTRESSPYRGAITRSVDFERLRGAVLLVQHDIERALGPSVVSVVIGDDVQDQLRRVNPPLERHVKGPLTVSVDGWAFVVGEDGAVGLDASDIPDWAWFVVHVADVLQELIIESSRFRGAAFPPCPKHPGTPLWPRVVNDQAVWACIDGAEVHIPIGAFGET